MDSRLSDQGDMQNEFTQSSLDNREDNEKALLQLAESFDPGEAPRSVLFQYKRGVILLRAKHATYDKIVAMLEKVGVKTSIFSVSRFCRQHRAEIKKLRVQLESRKPPAESSEPLLRTGDVPASSPGAPFAPADRQQPTTRRNKF
jgi:hypothetical protein